MRHLEETDTSVTQKGQVTIPAALRRRLGLRPHDRVRFAVDGDKIVLQKANSRLLAGYGAVTPAARPEDWQAVRETTEQLVAEEVARETA